MKILILSITILFSLNIFAQKNCEYDINVTDSIGTYKSTKEELVYERYFGNNKISVFFSLINAEGLPSLNLQMIQKNTEFISAKCIDKNSKIYLQLANGKIVTLLGMDQESCGNYIRNENENVRILSGYFLFMKDSFQELKNSPISIMRIKFSGETEDYIIKSELISELNQKTYYPENYFINNLKCIE
ncbi:hypothetical protein [Flavobacterium sp.]|uniref:hypothetical protein n=1 Tax=Flavobacterium sp. TaxID=239 RepID=UPI003752FB77